MPKFIHLALILLIILVALACGGSDSDFITNSTTITVDGSLNQTNSNLKPRSAATDSSSLVGQIDYIDNTKLDVYFSFNEDNLNFSTTAIASTPFYLKVFSSSNTNRVYMSRFVSATNSDIFGNNGEINAITTEHSERIEQYLSNNSSALTTTALENVNSDMFEDSSFSFFGLNFNTLYSNLSLAFQTFIDQRVSDLSLFDPENPETYFTTYDSTGSEIIIEFDSAIATIDGTPAVLYAYEFPKATSTLSSSSVSYSATLTLNNEKIPLTIDTSNRVVKFIPDSTQVDQTLTLSITASSGSETTATINKFIDIKTLQIDASTGSRIQLAGSGENDYDLFYGPLFDNDNFYIIAEKNETFYIESYLISDIQSPNAFGSSFASAAELNEAYPMPRAFSDIIIHNDLAYVADVISGVVKYDLTKSSTEVFTSQVTNKSISQLALAGSTLLFKRDSTNSFASLDTSSSVATLSDEFSLTPSTNLSIESIGSLGNNFYLTGLISGNYSTDFYDESFNYINSYTSIYSFQFSEDESGINEALYGVSNSTSTIISLNISNANIISTEFKESLITDVFSKSYIINGNALITYDDNDSAIAYSINSSNNVEQNSFDNERVNFTFNSDSTIFATIINLPEGNSPDSSKSLFYLPGFTDSNTNTWYIKGFELTPSP